MKKDYPKKDGFTLIEILIVTALLSVIGLSLFSVFNSGVSVWQRLTQEIIAEDVNLFFEKITSDIQSTFLFSEISFQGKEDEISFPVILPASSESEDPKGIGRAAYYYERSKQSLYREQSDFSEVYRGRAKFRKAVLNYVTDVHFEYYYHDLKSNTYAWTSSWPQSEISFTEEGNVVLPLAVKVEVEVWQNNTKEKFTKVISVMAGCCQAPVKK